MDAKIIVNTGKKKEGIFFVNFYKGIQLLKTIETPNFLTESNFVLVNFM
jgi:hypothetical protein